MVVVVAPLRQFNANLLQCGEERLVQLLIAQAAIEAFDESVLHLFAGCDIVPFNLRRISPRQDGVAGEPDPLSLTIILGLPLCCIN